MIGFDRTADDIALPSAVQSLFYVFFLAIPVAYEPAKGDGPRGSTPGASEATVGTFRESVRDL